MADKIKSADELIAEEFGIKTFKKEEVPSYVSVYKGSLALKRFEFLRNKFGNGITTGYSKLDEYFTFLPQQLYLLSAPTHHGKCFGKGTEILMYDGTIKEVEDVKVGDVLMGDDSTPRKVLSLARGVDNMFEVKPQRGNSYVVNEPHILVLKRTGIERNKPKGKEIEIPVSEYLTKSKTFKHEYYGFRKPVNFKEQHLPIEPYFVGLWLGDGTTLQSDITNVDPEVIKYIYEYASKNKWHVSKRSNITYSIVSQIGIKPLRVLLRENSLLGNKHIPQIYKINTRNNRLELLAGLLDSDGYYKDKNFEYITKLDVLAKDVAFLARSLGFCVTIKEKIIKGRTYFRLKLRGDCSIIPTKIKRKQAKKRIRKDDVLVTSIKVNFIGKDNYYGFIIDGNRRFLLSDFTVVHNTMMAMNMASKIANKGHKVLYASLEQGVFVSQFVNQILKNDSFPESFWILDSSEMLSVERLLVGINRLEEKPEMLVVDHIHFLKKNGRGATEDIDEIILKLQNLAKELEIPVLAISHLRKLNADKPPEMDDLRDSSSLSQVPSVVMMIYRKKDEGLLTNKGTLLLCKNRIQGKTGLFPFYIENSVKIEFEGQNPEINYTTVETERMFNG